MRKNICLIFNLHALPPLVPLFLLTHLFFLAHTVQHQKWVCENENKFIKRKVTRQARGSYISPHFFCNTHYSLPAIWMPTFFSRQNGNTPLSYFSFHSKKDPPPLLLKFSVSPVRPVAIFRGLRNVPTNGMQKLPMRRYEKYVYLLTCTDSYLYGHGSRENYGTYQNFGSRLKT